MECGAIAVVLVLLGLVLYYRQRVALAEHMRSLERGRLEAQAQARHARDDGRRRQAQARDLRKRTRAAWMAYQSERPEDAEALERTLKAALEATGDARDPLSFDEGEFDSADALTAAYENRVLAWFMKKPDSYRDRWILEYEAADATLRAKLESRRSSTYAGWTERAVKEVIRRAGTTPPNGLNAEVLESWFARAAQRLRDASREVEQDVHVGFYWPEIMIGRTRLDLEDFLLRRTAFPTGERGRPVELLFNGIGATVALQVLQHRFRDLVRLEVGYDPWLDEGDAM